MYYNLLFQLWYMLVNTKSDTLFEIVADQMINDSLSNYSPVQRSLNSEHGWVITTP